MDNISQPLDISESMELALKLYQTGELKQSMPICAQILNEYPDNAEALHLLGLIAHKLGKNEMAVQLIEKAISINYKVFLYHNTAGNIYLDLNRIDVAIACFHRALTLKPDFYEAHNDLGNALKEQGEPDEAIACYNSAIALKPDYHEAYNNLGVVLMEQGKLDEAIACYDHAIALKPDYHEVYNNLGGIYLIQEKLDEAIASYKRAIELNPDYADAWSNLGNVLVKIGKLGNFLMMVVRLEKAKSCYQKAIELLPGYAEAYNNLGGIYLIQKKLDDAVASHKRAIELKPDYADAWSNMGLALNAQLKYKDAADAYRHAIDIKPDRAESWNNLGVSLIEMSRLDEALESLEKAAELKPDYAIAYKNMGYIYLQQGKFEEAVAAYQKAISADETFAEAYLRLTECRKFTEADSAIIATIRKMLDREEIKYEDSAYLRFALGKIYDDLGRFVEAFSNYHEANRLENRKYGFDRDKHSLHISRLIETFPPEFFGQRSDYGSDADLPIMVLGLPRSGTTLLEQILANHPRVHGAGELEFWNDTEKKHPLEDIPAMTGDIAASIAGEYIEYLRSFSKTAWYITDKMPNNYLHIGLIHLIFPKVRIIHVQRNPVDTCLSIYFHKFQDVHPYAYDLDNLVFYYKQYQRLMSHWRDVLPSEVFHEVNYEELIKDPKNVSRELIRFCGLPWDEKCLRFHLTERPVKTASYWQVRQPIYKSSMARWKKYQPFLGPLTELFTEN